MMDLDTTHPDTKQIAASAVAVLASLAITPVTAQQPGAEPPMQLQAVNPSMSHSSPADSPLHEL
jgi:hypothetical protein